jgi:uncharacterized caspase-like protein
LITKSEINGFHVYLSAPDNRTINELLCFNIVNKTMKIYFCLSAALLLTGCATSDQQEMWFKQGVDSQQFEMDRAQCNAQAFSGANGNLMMVAIIQNQCLRGKGWQLVTKKYAETQMRQPSVNQGYLPADGRSDCQIFTNNALEKRISWSGQCDSGYAEGKGIAKHFVRDSLEQIVEGTYSSGKLSGFARVTISKGGKYVGEFRNGKFHGQGIFVEPNGKTTEGIWDQGNFVREAKVNLNLKDSADRLNEQSLAKNDLKGEQVTLNPDQLKIRNNTSDSVAIIIGIQNYKRLAKADFAEQDATKFAEYAHRALGIPKNKIKVLTETDADQAALLKTFRNWLPLNVNKGKTEVFVFYSGHGLPSNDGKSLYFLPHGVDQDLLDETAIDQKKIIAAIQSTQPKSVTMFIDSCYSGQSRNGSQLLAGAKPVALKNSDIRYPAEFTVFTASASDQISSASTDLQHGIFSFYLMKGMEGAADINKDGNITFGEMQQYLSENVQRQALAVNRVQVPQLIGDANRVLVGR